MLRMPLGSLIYAFTDSNLSLKMSKEGAVVTSVGKLFQYRTVRGMKLFLCALLFDKGRGRADRFVGLYGFFEFTLFVVGIPQSHLTLQFSHSKLNSVRGILLHL